jgi:hypothetical protein
LAEVMTKERLLTITLVLYDRIHEHAACQNKSYFLDVQSALQEELRAAYDFLSTEEHSSVWKLCTASLVDAIHSRNLDRLIEIDDRFRDVIGADEDIDCEESGNQDHPKASAITKALAWAIFVDSALLNARFLEDMKSVHAATGCPCPPEGGVQLFLPHPPPEVCQLFNDYVRCRWPLHVFALDPDTEDQNVGDAFSLRRELQLALALGFTSGQIGARSFSRYVRRIEQDIQTISLNRTMVGFSHGDNVFGWRFYPRVQTPPIDGNIEAIFRDLLYGGYAPGYYLRRRRLESAIRECDALVIMPSFVPFVDLDVTANWFRLADPKWKALDLKQVMRLSRSVKTLQDRAPQVSDEGRYRAGDVGMLSVRLEQLSARLPLQQQRVAVPYENTHGGFELLSAGVTDLAPELVGWYGAPGINPNGETSLFLVGNNFSVDQTRVVIGGLLLDPSMPLQSVAARMAAECDELCPPSPAQPKTTDQPIKPAGAAATSLPDHTASAPRVRPAEIGGAPSNSPDEQVTQAGWFRRNCMPQQPLRAPLATTIVNVPAGVSPFPGILTVVQAQLAAAEAKAQAAEAKIAATETKAAAAGAKQLSELQGVLGGIRPPLTADVRPGNFQLAVQADSAANNPAAPTDALGKTPDMPGKTPDTPGKTPDTPGKATDSMTPKLAAPPPVQLTQVELLSRQIMRVVIPAGVYSKNGIVDVHVATPYGVSPALEIPILCGTQQAPAGGYGYALDDKTKSIKVYYAFETKNNVSILKLQRLEQNTLKISWGEPTGSALNQVSAVFGFTIDGKKYTMPRTDKNGDPKKPLLINANESAFELDAKDLITHLRDLFLELDTVGYSPQTLLPPSLDATLTLKPLPPKGSPFAVQGVTIRKPVKFEFVYEP